MASKTLKQASQLHARGELDNAIEIYESLYETNHDTSPDLYMNYGAALRKKGNPQKGVEILKAGLRKWPENSGLWLNLGNSQIDLGYYFNATYSLRNAINSSNDHQGRLSLYGALQKAKLHNLAYKIARENYILFYKKEPTKIIFALLESILALPEEQRGNLASFQELIHLSEKDTLDESITDKINRAMLLAQTWAQAQKPEYVWHWYSKAKDLIGSQLRDEKKKNLKPSFRTNWHSLSWNLAIHFIKIGEFKLGWKLYEHGLQVPAEGPQKWQRSLKKPFHNKEVPLWQGENISGKNLLVLGEQGIGDTMMFATLLPKFAEKGINVFFIPGPRLEQIYKRSLKCCKILNLNEAKELNISSRKFDYQVPIGSLPQYYSDNFHDFESKNLLSADANLIESLKNKYYEYKKTTKGRLIGISWQGGGKEKRIPLKSISLDKISDLVLMYPNDTFVSLQYGNDKPHLDKLYQNTGKRIYHDETIDPLKDMDSWLAQVAAMDLVISIANTTIHGAGGLGVKTLCLVSNQADWRWINPDIYKGCYWYQSVDTTYQDLNGSWDSALQNAKKWLA